MVKVEYGDFYKFISSLGVTIIGATLLFSWLFMREPFSWISQTEQSSLTKNAKLFLEQREELILKFTYVFKYFVTISILIGIFLVIFGLVLWFKSQREIDKNQKLVNKKIEKELEDMTPTEIINSINLDINEITEEYISENKTGEDTKIDEATKLDHDSNIPLVDQVQTNHILTEGSNALMQKYLNIEDQVYNKFKEIADDTFTVLQNKRIGRVEFDIILHNNRSQHLDYIVEIKYIGNASIFNRLNDASRQVLASKEVYNRLTLRNAEPMILAIINSESYTRGTIVNLRRKIINGLYGGIKCVIITESDFNKITAKDFKELISLKDIIASVSV